jgi:prepilin-type N-terminal cleavage/methylation domain-containing protein
MFQQKAFTLIETIVTVFIVAILASFVFVQINDSINSGKDAKRKADIALLANAVVSYSADHYSNKPIDEDGCDIEGTCSSDIENSLKLYLSTFPKDPNPAAHYKYRSDGTNCFISTILSNGKIFEYECDIDAVASGLPVPGACGVAANTPSNGYASGITNWPTNNFCTAGTVNPVSPVFPGQGSSIAWTCIGDFLGSTITCTAYRAQDGVCGSREKRYADSATSYGTDTICTIGTGSPASPAFPTKGASVSWSCLGINNGTTDSCTAEHTANGICGTRNKTYADAATSYGTDTSCSAGTSSPASPAWPAKGASTIWACNGIFGGTNASCMADHSLNGVCGTNAQAYAYNITAYSGTFCSAGTSSPASPAFPAQGASVSWTCVGVLSGTNATCTASRAAAPVNGVCGTRNKTYSYSATSYGSDTICSAGTSSPASPAWPAAGSSTTWSCLGLNGGTTASCTAVHTGCVLAAHYPAMTCGYQILCSQYAWCPCSGYDVTYGRGCSLPERWGSPGSCSWESVCIKDNYCDWIPCTRTCVQASDGNFCMP